MEEVDSWKRMVERMDTARCRETHAHVRLLPLHQTASGMTYIYTNMVDVMQHIYLGG
jgi:hypothetical protein